MAPERPSGEQSSHEKRKKRAERGSTEKIQSSGGILLCLLPGYFTVGALVPLILSFPEKGIMRKVRAGKRIGRGIFPE